ncbi:hypothetical protein CCACVL1_09983 [Corchorus capsularis]|uniref:Uncharacterized protein n=1 Tax=Corchorus capsularis TaxID=210143 RepID=A0A1R3ITA8_COCAP|nr:hypothetical protein CCACVL1_09983 [Corchorus capsularis]
MAPSCFDASDEKMTMSHMKMEADHWTELRQEAAVK